MKLFKRVRKDAPTSEETHVARGVFGAILLIALIIAAIVWKFPPDSSAAPQKNKSAEVSKPKPAVVSKSVVGTPR